MAEIGQRNTAALTVGVRPIEVTSYRAHTYPRALEVLLEAVLP